ncbi:helix-turn-helix transcriptional regulator [Caballeronia sp. SBC2]|uniref:helix-turn-helix transcriptional regulator n=1 Tax=Caballeronia sp. SBC2 TaxID=2705547 RepID=UPI0013E1FC0B|nr:helix-turn-helix transcriptional regulator [Caballeronia sp. SBC2]QIE30072.1 helix-turn-helix protein [Caballeronia sp. SBC2]
MDRVSGKVDTEQRLVALGRAIRQKRRDLGISQEALAHHAGIDRSHMGKIERGERNVSVLNVLKIADSLDCKASDLFLSADL